MFDKTVFAILSNTLTLSEVSACFLPLSTKQLQHQYIKEVICLLPSEMFCIILFYFSLV